MSPEHQPRTSTISDIYGKTKLYSNKGTTITVHAEIRRHITLTPG